MKRLILVRHAKTQPLTEAESDFDRKLKKRGRKDIRLISDHLIGNNKIPEIIISSPAVRAMQTAKILAGAFSIPESKIVQVPGIYDGLTHEELVTHVNQAGIASQSVMVVGHNPDIATMAMKLSGDDFFHFPTAATAVIAFSVSEWDEIKPHSGRTELFVYPKELKSKKD
ncbi:SixA phosphatase family protein [Marinilabilia rubra]|uniref:Phosphoglycerate mutase n=1 Tax=Marinilabilia rubra TaxID=2162893 RepID=A0A2U2BCJ3_9BACT|nr:histidine phosphatase family protein [Marinilabilia rubra]PWE00794.1 phosphoglycerate mutase [Marinilabilia rubra]